MNVPFTGKIDAPASWVSDAGSYSLRLGLRPVQATISAPVTLFLGALTAMLLRHPDVPFYEIDRVMFGWLLVAVVGRTVILRQRFQAFERATVPMIGLTLLSISSLIGQPFDNQAWCLLAAKFFVPFALFHIAQMVFQGERATPAVRAFCADRSGLSLFYIDCFFDWREVVDLPSLYSG